MRWLEVFSVVLTTLIWPCIVVALVLGRFDLATWFLALLIYRRLEGGNWVNLNDAKISFRRAVIDGASPPEREG